eukprot:jgi/Mesvir1/19688/Mv09957-RA.1
MVLAPVKVASLLIKTLSKPVAKVAKNYIKTNETVKRPVIGLAQVLHRVHVRWQRWTYSTGNVNDSVKPLNEERAIDQAAEFVGEAIVFAAAVGAIAFEYERGKHAQQIKDDKVAAERQELQTLNAAAIAKTGSLQEQVDELQRELGEMRAKVLELEARQHKADASSIKRWLGL